MTIQTYRTNYHKEITPYIIDNAMYAKHALSESTIKGSLGKQTINGLEYDAVALYLNHKHAFNIPDEYIGYKGDVTALSIFNFSCNEEVKNTLMWLQNVNDIACDNDKRECLRILAENIVYFGKDNHV